MSKRDRRNHYASLGLDLDDERLINAATAADLMAEAEVAVVVSQG